MDILNIWVLSLLQGITEFLPVSSSGHLVLLPVVTGWNDQGLGFDVAAHVGSLIAVCFFLKKELVKLYSRGVTTLFPAAIYSDLRHVSSKVFRSVSERHIRDIWLLVIILLIGTGPVAIVGFLCRDVIAMELRDVHVVATTTVVFGLLLGLADCRRGVKKLDQIKLHDVVLIGLAQCLALIPGVSRAGITMTAALFLGFSRKSSAVFSMLLAVPVIILSAILEFNYFMEFTDVTALSDVLAVIFFSFLSAYICINLLLKFVERVGMLPFVLYRLFLGGLLFLFFV